MIVLERVVKSYPNGVGAINGISLHIKRGEFVFIVGDSGSGKSTLIKLLLKELEPTEGSIQYGRTDSQVPEEDRLRVSGFPAFEGPERI